MRNFRQLRIWSEAINLSIDIYHLTTAFPEEELYGLTRQIKRCAISIPSNIAEGCRGSNKELIHFLSISLGSAFELETQLEISRKLGFISKVKCSIIIEQLHILQKRINAFRTTILES